MVRLGIPLLVASLAAGAGASEGRVLDRVVAVVGNPAHPVNAQVITLQRLEFEDRLAAIRGADGGTPIAYAPVILSRDPFPDGGSPEAPGLQVITLADLRSALANLIGEQLASDQAKLLQITNVDPAAIDEQDAKLIAELGGPRAFQAFLDRYQVPHKDVREILERNLRVQAFMVTKVSNETKVGQADVDRYLSEHSKTLAPIEDPEERRRRAIIGVIEDRVLRQLYARAKVRIVDPDFADADAALQPLEGGWP